METTDKLLVGLIVLVAGAGTITWYTWPDSTRVPTLEPIDSVTSADGSVDDENDPTAETEDTATTETGDTGKEIDRALFPDALPEQCRNREPRLMLGQRRDLEGQWVPVTIMARLEYNLLFAGYRTWGIDSQVQVELTIDGETSGLHLTKEVTSRAFGSDPEAPCAWAGRVLWDFDEDQVTQLQQGSHTYTMKVTDDGGLTAQASTELMFTLAEDDAAGSQVHRTLANDTDDANEEEASEPGHDAASTEGDEVTAPTEEPTEAGEDADVPTETIDPVEQPPTETPEAPDDETQDANAVEDEPTPPEDLQ